MKKVLFFRDYKGFTGGHLKVWHYYNHVKQQEHYQANIAFTSSSQFGVHNPWVNERDCRVELDDLPTPDILFLAGLDWKLAPKFPSHIPIINLIQHVRHSYPNRPLYEFLSNRAIRICVSRAVYDALKATNRVNGPLYCIPNGVEDISSYKVSLGCKDIDVFICGRKNRGLAERLRDHFENQGLVVYTNMWMPRSKYLEVIARSKIGVFLPGPTEGFYLPALESMFLNTQVVCPDVLGNSDFCLPDVTAVVPSEYEFLSLCEAVKKAISMSDKERSRMLQEGRNMAEHHHLSDEQNSFIDILENSQAIWDEG